MSAREEAVKLAVHYMVTINPNVTSSDSYTEVENLVDRIIEAATDKATAALLEVLSSAQSVADSILGKAAGHAALKRTNEIRMSRRRNAWVEKKRGTLSDQIVGLLEQAYEAGWHDREEEHKDKEN